MPVSTIFILRHGHRLAWNVDPKTGSYTSSHRYPTGRPADPPLASHGVKQAEETGEYLAQLLGEVASNSTLRIYSSLFYRCFETLRPTVERIREIVLKRICSSDRRERVLRDLRVRGESGLGEWFGRAWFEQPTPASPEQLRGYFPWIDTEYCSLLAPDRYGERIETLHDRVAQALSRIIKDVDAEFEAQGRGSEMVTLLICGHAAQIVCSGRVLTGMMPDDPNEEDFRCYTCGISKFVRKSVAIDSGMRNDDEWRSNGGVAGGWDCVLNSDCKHLSQGEERGWHFHGDESFDSYIVAAKQSALRRADGNQASSSKL